MSESPSPVNKLAPHAGRRLTHVDEEGHNEDISKEEIPETCPEPVSDASRSMIENSTRVVMRR